MRDDRLKDDDIHPEPRKPNPHSVAKKKMRAKAKQFRLSTGAQDLSWAGHTREVPGASERLGIVCNVHDRTIDVMAQDGSVVPCSLAPRLPHGLMGELVVGDRVIVAADDGVETVIARTARQTLLRRLHSDRTRRDHLALEEHIIAANIDVAIIVAAAADPAFHPRFVDRYLIICRNGGVKPLLCYNKRDLVAERHEILSWYEAIGVPVIETSVVTGEGVDELRDAIRGKVAVLAGHSGVGKTSLVNSIVPDAQFVTQEVSAKTRRGKHTTTGSALYRWDEGSFLIDTPGIRGLGLEHLTRQELIEGFPEFLEYVTRCTYRGDCTHSHEPGCAVKQALEGGQLNLPRYESYLRLLRE